MGFMLIVSGSLALPGNHFPEFIQPLTCLVFSNQPFLEHLEKYQDTLMQCHGKHCSNWLHLALTSGMGNFSRHPWVRPSIYLLAGCVFNSHCPSQLLNSGRLRPITLEKQPSIRSTRAPPRPSRAKPPAHCKGSPLAT